MDTADSLRLELANPFLDPARLAAIAASAPHLGAAIARHPAVYPDLLDWLAAHGDDEAQAAVAAVRTTTEPGVNPLPPVPVAAASSGDANSATPNAYPASSTPVNPFGASPATRPGTAKAPRAPGKLSLPVVIALGVTAVLVMGGGVAAAVLLPRLIPAASPEAAAERLLTSVASLDYVSLGSSIAPSEASLFLEPLEELRSIDTTSDDETAQSAGDAVARLQRAVSVDMQDLVFDTEEITKGVELVTLTDGVITIDGDPSEIAAALVDLSAVQLRVQYESWGYSDSEIVDLLDEERDRIEDSLDLPFELDIEQVIEDSYFSTSPFSVVTVDEGGWYVSPLLSTAHLYAVGYSYDGSEIRLGDEIPDPVVSRTPEEAIQATFDAITDTTSGRDYLLEVAATLPLAERRLVAIYGPSIPLLHDSNPWAQLEENGGYFLTANAEFSDAVQSGSTAQVRSWEAEIDWAWSGSNVTIVVDDHCADYSSYLEYYDSYWEEWDYSSDSGSVCLDDVGRTGGFDLADLGIDQPSLMAVQQGGGWQFSALTTVSSLFTDATRALAQMSRDGDLSDIFALPHSNSEARS